MVVIACFMKIIYVGWLADKAIPDLVAKVMASAVWFCIGMLITATPFKKSKLADGIAAGMVILACILSYYVYSTPTDNAKAQFIFASIFVLVITYFFQSKEQYKTDPLLVIDDFGMERGTEYALEQIYNIIDSRYRSRKPLIVTTNLTLTELKNPQDTAHARIYDRLLELCTPIACTGPSMRKDIGQAKLNLLKTLLA